MRTIKEIAFEICQDWKRPYFGAIPYLRIMLDLNTIDEMYGYDSAEMIVRYFLSNSRTWKGAVARDIKKELNEMLK